MGKKSFIPDLAKDWFNELDINTKLSLIAQSREIKNFLKTQLRT